MLNLETELGAQTLQRLRDEQIIWLTTVRADGTPQPSPVWFLWDGSTFLIYSRPNTPKLRNISANPHIALNLNSDEYGGNILVLTGEAVIDQQARSADQVAEYIAKYDASIKGIGMNRASFAQAYSVAVRVTPTHARGQ
jgi:PPOX class probable F420-dependent enzyme